ncbi:hypothetical protein DQ04_05701050 [Trypanosoma grayi]|uniref:hypothetical protein n=1 Tax=Trypanosoma grayi TaxID=71804 RepID=UPI0004F45CF9|nr:hypothetical protein DQ04_05701050 [Trypanosoma grayi]KEG09162.1 hypothetical protein DQ04_05701050 [Trypanosoma grayi]
MEYRTLDYRLKSLHGQRDVWEQLEELQDAVTSLRQRQEQQTAQWQVVSAEQRQHCSDLASMYQQLQELLDKAWEGDGTVLERRCNGKTATSTAAAAAAAALPHHDALKSEVRDLLLNFKQHIERHTTSTNQRLDGMQRGIESIQSTLQGASSRLTQVEERLTQFEQQQRQLQQRVSCTPSFENIEELRETLTQRLQSMQEDSVSALQRSSRSVDEKLAKHETKRREEQETLHRETLQSIEEAARELQGELESVRRGLETHVVATDAKTRALEERARRHIEETLKSHVARTCAQIQEVQSELSGKHVQLVEDTMEAVERIAQVADGLPRKVALLQEDAADIRENLQRHGEVLNEQCLQGSLQGAFDEVKDWLQDLEQRALSRGEFDEALVGVDEKIAALRREFIIRSPVEHATDESDGGEGGRAAGPQ